MERKLLWHGMVPRGEANGGHGRMTPFVGPDQPLVPRFIGAQSRAVEAARALRARCERNEL
jgi:hypothetical protein